tara:strand:+ start:15263 stop:15628 length:366 start_codon:yes stop_codon:yes gene_type:complete
MEIKSLFALCVFLAGLSLAQALEPLEVVLTSEDSTISAQIQEGGVFEGSNDTHEETLEFSGKVKEEGARYRVKITVTRRVKSSGSTSNMQSEFTVDVAEPKNIRIAQEKRLGFTLLKSGKR